MLKQIIKSIIGDSRGTVLRLRGIDYRSEKIDGVYILVPRSKTTEEKYIEIGRSGGGESEIFTIVGEEKAKALMNDAVQKSDKGMTKNIVNMRKSAEKLRGNYKKELVLYEEMREEMKRLEDEIKALKNQVQILINSEK